MEKRRNNTNGSQPLYSVISFFCGCGGFDLGFMGGFFYKGKTYKTTPLSIIRAYDIDGDCIQTYRANVGPHATQKDLSCYSPLDTPPADVLIGGFPCQDFSVCGPRRGLKSDRGRLYMALVKYMDAYHPKVVIGENVPGLERLGEGAVLKRILGDLADCGYLVRVWKLFCPEYGIPQRRTRLFIVCVRRDMAGFPKKPVARYFGPPYRHNIRWAIQDLEGVSDDRVPNQSQWFKASRCGGGRQGDEVSSPDRPAYTIRANPKSRIQFHYRLNRRLTIRECARLQTFPDYFNFPHSATTNIRQIGNAVPPVLAHEVGKSIADFLRDYQRRLGASK